MRKCVLIINLYTALYVENHMIAESSNVTRPFLA